MVDGKLQAQGDSQQAFTLTNIGADKFEFKEAGIIIRFNSEKKLMVLQQGGKEYNFQKK